MKPEEIVENGARCFEALEKRIEKAQKAAMELHPLTCECCDNHLIGALQYGKWEAQVEEIFGLLAKAKRMTYEFHREATDMAESHNIDLPQLRSGGGR